MPALEPGKVDAPGGGMGLLNSGFAGGRTGYNCQDPAAVGFPLAGGIAARPSMIDAGLAAGL